MGEKRINSTLYEKLYSVVEISKPDKFCAPHLNNTRERTEKKIYIYINVSIYRDLKIELYIQSKR